ncbi:MAG: Lipoprotein-releasing system ATP-binding protein LolD [Candidatus Thorarchaeota archaeon AB_25]|nr:MAG: Lipoprotein-releasing system ATP-binding protein LolD [Candidatus Thorarchaeota archaeon AB_25]
MPTSKLVNTLLAPENHVAVECLDLHREFQDGSRVIRVLQGTNLKVDRGEFVAIVGASGSGKTTLLNLIGGLDRPTSGTILVDGDSITELDDERMSEVRRHKIGVLFQDQHLLPIFTALENVEVPMLLDDIPQKERRERAIKLLETVFVDHRAEHMPHELSGGMRSRVALARALANDPAVLLCDEPTGDLDHKTGGEIIQLMRDLAKNQNRAVIAATHDPETARMADRILLLRDGVLVDELVGDFFKHSKVDVSTRKSDERADEGTSTAE